MNFRCDDSDQCGQMISASQTTLAGVGTNTDTVFGRIERQIRQALASEIIQVAQRYGECKQKPHWCKASRHPWKSVAIRTERLTKLWRARAFYQKNLIRTVATTFFANWKFKKARFPFYVYCNAEGTEIVPLMFIDIAKHRGASNKGCAHDWASTTGTTGNDGLTRTFALCGFSTSTKRLENMKDDNKWFCSDERLKYARLNWHAFDASAQHVRDSSLNNL